MKSSRFLYITAKVLYGLWQVWLIIALILAIGSYHQLRGLGYSFGESIWPLAGRWLVVTAVPGLLVIQLKSDTEKWRRKKEEEG